MSTATDILQSQIDTIVIVMMENRSFDHLLGFLSHEQFDRRTDVEGLHVHGPKFSWDNADEAGKPYPPTATPDGYLPSDLPHSRDLVAVQLNDRAMTGFVKAYFKYQSIDQNPVPMRFCRPSDIPITAALARRYSVCDQWFASLPDDTMPNRLMALSGYTKIDSTSGIKPVLHPLPDQTTIFDWLKGKGKDYRIYVDAKPIYDKIAPTNLLLMDNQWGHLENAHTLDTLQGHWASSEPAPSVIYCEPFYNDFATAIGRHGNCNHCPLPVAFGEDFIKRVYLALTSNPQKWARTMMVLCYDEHGGFFDHVKPPLMTYAPPAGNTWTTETPFQTLGVRIPALVISPWVKPLSCYKGLLDHTSILQLMVDKFGQPTDLEYFGDAAARKANKVQSLAETLTATSPSADILELGEPPEISSGATTPPVTNLGNLFRRAITILNDKG